MADNNDEEKFSDDPQENLRMENEFIKLKMKAQFGDSFLMQPESGLPPQIENEFLKHIIQFEENFQKAEFITLAEKIGIKDPKSSAQMTEQEITEELKKLEQVMEEHSIFLDKIYGPYPDKLIYDFIINELLAKEIDKNPGVSNVAQIDISGFLRDQNNEEEDGSGYDDENNLEEDSEDGLDEEDEENSETSEDMSMPEFKNGWHFVYEEFHPNNEKDIEKNAAAFMQHWEERSFNEYSMELAYHMVFPPANQMTREELYKKMYLFFDAFTAFANFKFIIGEIKFEEQDNDMMLGHCAGAVAYDALMDNGEVIHYEGPYKLYMERKDNYWSIMYFVMPGFRWD